MLRNCKQHAAWLLITLGLCLRPLSLEVVSAAQDVSTPEITLRVYNYSWATPEDIRDMESAAMKILGRSGISVQWIQCSPILKEAGLSSQCGSALGRTVFQLLVTNNPNGLRGDALGSTIQGTSILTVSYNRSRDLAAVHDLAVGRVLAHAVAHEMGHLLLGSAHHAANGIMKARFGPDLDDMDRGWLVFTPEQSRLLQKQVVSLSRRIGSK
jgi:hypothetical protein